MTGFSLNLFFNCNPIFQFFLDPTYFNEISGNPSIIKDITKMYAILYDSLSGLWGIRGLFGVRFYSKSGEFYGRKGLKIG